ncbi:MAG: gluconate 2-dehydrogenase subunit 3 family protein [Bacteroidetes bacterium]|nr:gluconate 2-dehydrogenase subunit 3 family protein [Bacteroidota bacterium]
MNRRESLRLLGITSLGTGLLLDACKTEGKKEPAAIIGKENLEDTVGLQEFEIERLKKLMSEPPFFNEHERQTLVLLADIIIPKDEVSGSASEAKVVDFIEFIVKDIPEHQVPMRGGLKWLDMQCLNLYGHSFIGCTTEQQLEMVEEIAYPSKAKPQMQPGVSFFNRMRNLTASGFYTSQIGIKDIGYMGNSPNKGEGVPADVLAQFGLVDFKIS